MPADKYEDMGDDVGVCFPLILENTHSNKDMNIGSVCAVAHIGTAGRGTRTVGGSMPELGAGAGRASTSGARQPVTPGAATCTELKTVFAGQPWGAVLGHGAGWRGS